MAGEHQIYLITMFINGKEYKHFEIGNGADSTKQEFFALLENAEKYKLVKIFCYL